MLMPGFAVGYSINSAELKSISGSSEDEAGGSSGFE